MRINISEEDLGLLQRTGWERKIRLVLQREVQVGAIPLD